MYHLPKDILKCIYDFDPTYHEHMTKYVFPELEEKLYGSWLNNYEIYTNDLGLLMRYTWGIWAYLSDMTENEEEEDEEVYTTAITYIN
jgi:hypothetical protein